MIGILIVTHSRLGEALIEAAEFIFKEKLENVLAVSIDINEDPTVLRKRILDGMKAVDGREGLLLLTDMFGGTPSNLCYSFLSEGRVEVLSGVNLPVLIKAVNSRRKMPLDHLAAAIETFGKQSISLASGILKGNKRQ